MAAIIRFVLSNYPLVLLVLGFALGLAAYARGPRRPGALAEALLAYYLLCAIGLSYLYNFVMHVFFQSTAAAYIGWQPSPFETEVGFASLGFAAVAPTRLQGLLRDARRGGGGPAFFLGARPAATSIR